VSTVLGGPLAVAMKSLAWPSVRQIIPAAGTCTSKAVELDPSCAPLGRFDLGLISSAPVFAEKFRVPGARNIVYL